MSNKVIIILVVVVLVGLGIGLKSFINGEGKSSVPPMPTAAQKSQADEPGHEAHHGGCLNEICSCETGHAEVKIEGNTLKCWFIGGGQDTGRAVRVPDKSIPLKVKIKGSNPEKSLVLLPKPNDLAEEKIGDCSYFEARAEWLKGIKEFTAVGKVNFKGKEQDLIIDYPQGHDPDHDQEHK
jgi:hypothetical protein